MEKNEDTTQETEGVSEEQSLDTEKPDTFINRRNNDFDAIVAARTKEIEEDVGPLEEKEEPAEPETPETPEEEPEEEAKEEEPFIEIEVKVDGEVKKEKVPLSEMTALYQKKAATEKRFTEVSQLKAKLERESKEKEREAEPSDKDALENKEDADPVESVINDPKVIEARKKRDEAILYGEEEEVAKASLEYDKAFAKAVMATRKGAGRQEEGEDFYKKVEVAVAKREINRNFENDFKDLRKDKDFWEFFRGKVASKVNDKLADGADGFSYDVYKEAGDEVREEIGSSIGVPPPKKKDNVLTISERQKNKRRLDTVDAASAKMETDSREEKPMSRSDIVKEMARKRPGQTNY